MMGTGGSAASSLSVSAHLLGLNPSAAWGKYRKHHEVCARTLGWLGAAVGGVWHLLLPVN
jgi:hypothetical protein